MMKQLWELYNDDTVDKASKKLDLYKETVEELAGTLADENDELQKGNKLLDKAKSALPWKSCMALKSQEAKSQEQKQKERAAEADIRNRRHSQADPDWPRVSRRHEGRGIPRYPGRNQTSSGPKGKSGVSSLMRPRSASES